MSSRNFQGTPAMSITRILHLELLGFLYALAAVVLFRMLTGRINITGLLTQKDRSNQTSPERVQLLLATIAASAQYLGEVARTTSGSLPDVSNNWLYLMGGSSGIYLLRKAWTTFNSMKRT
jgi:hypothetical protein